MTRSISSRFFRVAAALLGLAPIDGIAMASTSAECAPGMIHCLDRGQCVDVSSDVENCGACSNYCADGSECVHGACLTPADVQRLDDERDLAAAPDVAAITINEV